MTRLVMLDPSAPDRLERMRPFLPEGWEISTAASHEPQAQKAALEGASFAITGDVRVGPELMATPGLKAVHKWGVGYDNIDLEAARENGVRVLRTTGSNAVAVAETTLGLILALNRNIVRGHGGLIEGRWRKGELAPNSWRLSGKTVGIVGFGYVGKALARLLAPFGCTVLYTKRKPLSDVEEAETGARFASLEDLLSRADVVTLNCELNASTRGLIDRSALSRMKPEAILVNVARGGVMVEADVAEAVREGRLRGAAVDVFETEPLPAGNPLVGLDRVIVTPHLAAISADSFEPSVRRMIANLKAVQDGSEPDPVDILV